MNSLGFRLCQVGLPLGARPLQASAAVAVRPSRIARAPRAVAMAVGGALPWATLGLAVFSLLLLHHSSSHLNLADERDRRHATEMGRLREIAHVAQAQADTAIFDRDAAATRRRRRG